MNGRRGNCESKGARHSLNANFCRPGYDLRTVKRHFPMTGRIDFGPKGQKRGFQGCEDGSAGAGPRGNETGTDCTALGNDFGWADTPKRKRCALSEAVRFRESGGHDTRPFLRNSVIEEVKTKGESLRRTSPTFFARSSFRAPALTRLCG